MSNKLVIKLEQSESEIARRQNEAERMMNIFLVQMVQGSVDKVHTIRFNCTPLYYLPLAKMFRDWKLQLITTTPYLESMQCP